MSLAETAQRYFNGIDYRLQRARYALGGKTFSHSGEQQILQRYLQELLPPSYAKTAVDIGAGNGMRWSNTYSLFLKGWTGVGIEADQHKFLQLQRAYRDLPGVHALQSRAAPGNIAELLKSLGITSHFGVLSLDIDGNDYWVLDAILKELRPALIVTEINEKIPPPLRFVVKFDPDFRLRHHFYGYSIAALEDLCERHDYGILELEYNNAFLTPRELGQNRFVSSEAAYRMGYLERADRKQRFAANLNLEAVHSRTPDDAIDFLHQFYAVEAGNYYLERDRRLFEQALNQNGQ
jgi:hypothetical protein